jgi:hypothetical protein
VSGVAADGEDEGALDGKVDGEDQEPDADDPERHGLPALTGACELPDHDGTGSDLDQRVETEASERHRSGTDRRVGEDDDPDDVPSECDAFEDVATAKQLGTLG